MRRGGVRGNGRVWIGLIAGAVLVAACGGGGDGEGSAGTQAGAASSTTTTAATTTTSAVAAELADFDPGAIADMLIPAPTIDGFEVTDIGEGNLYYTYRFPPHDLGDGVTLRLTAYWQQNGDELIPMIDWILTGDDTSPADYEFIASVPKTMADHIDAMEFEIPPDEVILADPVFRWTVDLEMHKEFALFTLLPKAVSLDDPNQRLQALLLAADQIRIHASLQDCARWAESDPEWANQCYLTVVGLNPHSFSPELCDIAFNRVTGDEATGAAGYRQACKVMLGLGDAEFTTSCDAAGDPNDIERCRLATFRVLSEPCTGLDGLEEQICIYEAVAASGDLESCAHISNPAMANDCRAAVSGDAEFCSAIEDDQQRLSCCSTFAGTDKYDACAGDAVAAGGSEETTTTTTTTTAAPTPPIGGDVASPYSDGFEAVYACTNTSPDGSYEYTNTYKWEGGRMLEATLSSSTYWDIIEPVHQLDYPYSLSGSLGVVIPLPLTGVTVPSDSFDMGTGEGYSDLNTYSELVYTPGKPVSLDLSGWSYPAVPFTGSFTWTENISEVSGSYSRTIDIEEVFTLASWYHPDTGLLLASEWSRERTHDYDSEGLPGMLGMRDGATCVLVSTTLDLTP